MSAYTGTQRSEYAQLLAVRNFRETFLQGQLFCGLFRVG